MFFFYCEFGRAYLQDHRRLPYGKFQDYLQGYIKIIIREVQQTQLQPKHCSPPLVFILGGAKGL